MNTRFLSLAVFFLALAARPAYLESDHGTVADPQPEPPVHIPRPIPEPVDQPPLARLVDRLVIGVAQQYGQLTVYPLQLRWRHPTHQRLQYGYAQLNCRVKIGATLFHRRPSAPAPRRW